MQTVRDGARLRSRSAQQHNGTVLWTCEKCGRQAHVRRFPVRCACGAKSNGRNGQTPNYVTARRQACSKCDLRISSNRCKEIELGCSIEYQRRLFDPSGTCPRGRWPTFKQQRIHQQVTFTRTSDLVAATYELAAKLPPDLTAIAGVPRSGLIPAGILACHLHLPIYTVMQGRMIPCGIGTRSQSLKDDLRAVLVVDDTVCRGGTMKKLRSEIISDVIYAAVFCQPGSEQHVDMFGRHLPAPHLLEWNFASTYWTVCMGMDLDGVICQDCTAEMDDDGRRYERFLRNAGPKHLPRFKPVRAIITARLEKYRRQTEAWLRLHGCKWQQLVMCPAANNKERAEIDIWAWKAEQADRLGCEVYLESSLGGVQQMDKICRICTPVWVP